MPVCGSINESSNSDKNALPMEVLVFTTSVESHDHIKILTPFLNSFAGKGRWNFALDDCDRILRIVSGEIEPLAAIRLLRENGFECKELDG